jgi:hypothetical protein
MSVAMVPGDDNKHDIPLLRLILQAVTPSSIFFTTQVYFVDPFRTVGYEPGICWYTLTVSLIIKYNYVNVHSKLKNKRPNAFTAKNDIAISASLYVMIIISDT